MDSILGVKYSGGVVIAADSNNARSILVYQHNLDKIAKIAPNAILGLSGPNADLVSFSEYVSKNLKLYSLSNPGQDLSTKAVASFCRNELATALRKGPYQVQTLLGGWDATKGSPEDDAGEGR
jgi:20S proteasome alpha/beta subunit